MNFLPKIERVTRDVTVSHFLLMLGYKLFAFYFPLFLLQKGLSAPQVGYAFLLIYLPIALFAPIAGFFNHRVNPSLLMVLGISGYGAYSLGMLFLDVSLIFYAFQVLLGISASLFFVSSRAILMGFHLEKPDRSFGWFYSAPFYTDVLGPAFGAFLIWKFGFTGVFLASFLIYAFNALFTLARLWSFTDPLKDSEKVREIFSHYGIFLNALRQSGSSILLAVSFIALVTGGVYHAFFVVFLKDIGWTQNQILLFGTLSAALFTPLSLYGISKLGKQTSAKSMLQGFTVYSLTSILFGLLGKGLSFVNALVLMLLKDFGSFMANSGRSGKITNSLSSHPEEAGAVDTIFSPLAQSVGFLLAIVLIGKVDYPVMFVMGGVLVLLCTIFAGIAKRGD
ncbi:MAG: MFS transporter [Candidatus Wildermuthbacteria bacterium]|nr:MFS transporter [Candidatus Wildermuthbacteria bacterium]